MLDILMPLGTMAVFGFTGSFHCGVMCSPLVACCQNKTLQYFIARALTYSSLGFLGGFIGLGFFKNFLNISAHGLSILVAFICLMQILFIFNPKLFYFSKNFNYVIKTTSFLLKKSSFSKEISFGIGTALLPCGFLYSALLLSISYSNPYTSSLCMFVFAIASSPTLILGRKIFFLFAHKLHYTKKILFSFLLILVAFFSLIRGMSIHLS